MKLAPLLAQFLYANKRLDLEGIGSFSLDPAVIIEKEPTRSTSSIPPGIQFENNPQVKESPELIAFISGQTGKMKALAMADLSSHIELIQQFLNIGKPFLLEGIGSIARIKAGQFEFTPGEPVPQKMKDEVSKDDSTVGSAKSTYKPFLEKQKSGYVFQGSVLALLVIVGLGLALFGGYMLYKRNNRGIEPNLSQNNRPTNPGPSIQSATLSGPENKVEEKTVPANNNAFKYVLETAGKKRAINRYNKLKEYRWDVQMETKDSIQYKIFLILPTLAMDTSRVADSLTALNGRKVYIEQ